MTRRHVTIVIDLDDNGSPIEINRAWQENEILLPTGDLGMTPRENVTEETLSNILPNIAAMMAQNSTLSTALAERDVTLSEMRKKLENSDLEKDQLVYKVEEANLRADQLMKELEAANDRINQLEEANNQKIVAISRQQVAMEMLSREMISADEAISLAQTGMAPIFIASLIETLPFDQQIIAKIELTEPFWKRDNGLLSALSSLPNAHKIDLDEFFASAANR